MTTKWKPWKTFAKDWERQGAELPIDGPPCAKCYFWKPQRNYMRDVARGTGYMIEDGVVLCHATEMHNDFSCFRADGDAVLGRGGGV